MALAVRDLYPEARGTLLCFLPGAPRSAAPRRTSGRPSARSRGRASSARIADNQSTGPGVGAIDGRARHSRHEHRRNVADGSWRDHRHRYGTQKVARFDPDRGLDTLHTERIARDSAEQRAGRAGRLGPGRVRRLWSPLDALKAHRESEIHRVDLSDVALAIVAWGGQVASFEWFEAPDPSRIDASGDRC